MRYLLTSLAILSMVAVGCDDVGGPPSSGDPVADATTAAESWLGLVDRGAYGDSWSETCEYFRGAVPEEQWESQIRGARAPLGDVISRTVTSARYATELPGAPDGEYVVIEYASSFENKASAVETITPMRDADGVFRVSGYFIR